MKHKKLCGIVTCLFILIQINAQQSNDTSIAMGKVEVVFHLQQQGVPQYNVLFDKHAVVNWSNLGFSLENDTSFYNNFELVGVEKKQFDKTWQPVWGEVKNIRNHYQEMAIHLKKRTPVFYWI